MAIDDNTDDRQFVPDLARRLAEVRTCDRFAVTLLNPAALAGEFRGNDEHQEFGVPRGARSRAV